MIELRINLLEKRQVSPVVSLWRRRLYLLLAIISIVLLFDGAAIFVVRTIVLARAKDLEHRYNQLVDTIEAEKEKEGLYLTLASRLDLVDSVRKQSASVQTLPEAMDGLLGDSIEVKKFTATRDKTLDLDLQTDDPRAIELMLDKLSSYKTEEFSFSNIVIENTAVDEEGNYSISLSLKLKSEL